MNGGARQKPPMHLCLARLCQPGALRSPSSSWADVAVGQRSDVAVAIPCQREGVDAAIPAPVVEGDASVGSQHRALDANATGIDAGRIHEVEEHSLLVNAAAEGEGEARETGRGTADVDHSQRAG